MWKQPYRDAFGKYAANPEYRELLSKWQEHWKEHQGEFTRKSQEYADYRKRLDPIYEVVKPYESYWQMQGMDTVSGVRQLVTYASELARDPAGMIPKLAQMYGVDLASLVAEQPYVPQEVLSLQQQLQQVQGQFQQLTQYQQQQQYARLNQEIQAFQTAVDEQGNPKAPHFERVFDSMVQLANAGLAKSIQEAYDKAVALNPEIQAEVQQQAQQAQAVTRAAEANRALEASRGVRSKGSGGAQPVRSAREDYAAALAGR